jgi:RNA polymerase sigma factor (sigma-70 family)
VRSFDILVRAYWKPVYKHVRLRWSRPTEEARDLTQGFFARAFEKRHFSNYDPSKALFRTYIKACLDRYVMEVARGQKREKRGGGAVRLSLDFDVADNELARLGPLNPASVESCFEAEWTRSLLSSAVEALEAACADKGKEIYFAVFRRYILDGDDVVKEASAGRKRARLSYATVAKELEISVHDVTNYLAWTRREFRSLVLAKLRDITATDEEFRSEARSVLGVDP